MKKLLVIFLCTLQTAMFVGQEMSNLASDRPGQAFTPSILSKNNIQVQSGLSYFGSSQFGSDIYLRYGLFSKLELNTSVAFGGSSLFTNFESFNLGVRFNLNSNLDSYQSALLLSHDFKLNNETRVTYTLSDNLSKRLSYTINTGALFNKDIDFVELSYVGNLGYSLLDDFGIFAEVFGTAFTNNHEVNFDAGFFYFVNPNLQIDAFFGDTNGFFASIGVTWRITTAQKSTQ